MTEKMKISMKELEAIVGGTDGIIRNPKQHSNAGVNYHVNPGIYSNFGGTFANGEEVKVIARDYCADIDQTWYKVRAADGREGWILSSGIIIK